MFLLLGSVHDLLDDLNFFDKEGSGDSILNASSADVSTICSRDGSLVLGDKSISSWSEGWDSGKWLLADGTEDSGSSLLNVLGNQISTWGSNGSDLVGSGVPGSGSSVGDSRGH